MPHWRGAAPTAVGATSRRCSPGSDLPTRQQRAAIGTGSLSIGFLDGEVLDGVLRFFPALDMRIFVHDESAQVLGVEHDDVRLLGVLVEAQERADEDAVIRSTAAPVIAIVAPVQIG